MKPVIDKVYYFKCYCQENQGWRISLHWLFIINLYYKGDTSTTSIDSIDTWLWHKYGTPTTKSGAKLRNKGCGDEERKESPQRITLLSLNLDTQQANQIAQCKLGVKIDTLEEEEEKGSPSSPSLGDAIYSVIE